MQHNKNSQLRFKNSTSSGSRHGGIPSFSRPDPIEKERYAQQQEHCRKRNRGFEPYVKEKHTHKPHKKPHPQSVSLEGNLEKTWQWLSETFPVFFGPDSIPRPLYTHIVRDIKDHYKRLQTENSYPKDLIIKAALARYMETPEYLRCLQEGAFKYNIDGIAVETVTKEEKDKATLLLEQH